MSKARLAVLELVFAGSLWGFGFISAIWALTEMGPLTITATRFVLASIVGVPIALAIPSLRRHANFATLKLAFLPGLMLSMVLVFQTWGLMYTTATKSSFITCLYTLMVPILEAIWLKRRLPRLHLIFVVLALFGVALICDLPGAVTGRLASGPSEKQMWNWGDFLTFICAIAATIHILWFALIRDRIGSSFVFNLAQGFWAGLLPLVLAFFIEKVPAWPLSAKPLIGILSLSFGSTLIAFALQVRAQKEISPSLASLLFLLESPFATLFAVTLLEESLRTDQWVGAGLIMIAVAASTMFTAESQDESQIEESAGIKKRS